MGETTMTGLDLVAEPGVQEVTVTRVFDAPRVRVFKTYTDPALVPKWWGPRAHTTIVDTMDVRPGGMWRFISRDRDGHEFAFHGVYHAVVAPERIVSTFEFEGTPGHVLLDTATFEERDGRTTLTLQSVYQSVGDRDGMLGAGMESGLSETLARLAELVETNS